MAQMAGCSGIRRTQSPQCIKHFRLPFCLSHLTGLATVLCCPTLLCLYNCSVYIVYRAVRESIRLEISVAVRSKARICDCSLAEMKGSDPAEVMCVCFM